jgi:hypothetical protein
VDEAVTAGTNGDVRRAWMLLKVEKGDRVRGAGEHMASYLRLRGNNSSTILIDIRIS